MFPGSPRVRHNVRVISLGAVSNIALGADDPDFIVLEPSNLLFSDSRIILPNTAPIGKVFRFALNTTAANNPDMSTEFINIIFPTKYIMIDASYNVWKMYAGQRPSFTYGPNGWIPDACNGVYSLSGFKGSRALSIGSGANGSRDGTAIGLAADAYNQGVAVGQSAVANTSGVAVGYGANGSTSGVAVGKNANGSTSGVAVGYGANTNSKDAAVALGLNSTAQRYRELVKAADGAVAGSRSWSMVDWYGDTANATPTEILLGGTANQRCVLLNNSAFMFSMQIIAAITGAGDTSSWTITGAIKRGANAASTVLVGVPTVTMTGQDGGAAAWVVAVTADTTNGSLNVTVTGEDAKTIRWNATATLSEVRF